MAIGFEEKAKMALVMDVYSLAAGKQGCTFVELETVEKKKISSSKGIEVLKVNYKVNKIINLSKKITKNNNSHVNQR